MTTEEMALNLGRSCRIASMERQMDELWGMMMTRPSTLTSLDWMSLKAIEGMCRLLTEELSASSAAAYISLTRPTDLATTSANSALGQADILPSLVPGKLIHPTTTAET